MEYRKLKVEEINQRLFAHFDRTQHVTQCWRKENDQWVIRNVPFVEQWSNEDYATR